MIAFGLVFTVIWEREALLPSNPFKDQDVCTLIDAVGIAEGN